MQSYTNINPAQDNTFTTPGLSKTAVSYFTTILLCYLGLFINLGFIVLIAWQTGIPVVW